MIELVLRFHGTEAESLGRYMELVEDVMDFGFQDQVEVLPLDAVKVGWELQTAE